jgi:hypothetical protein
MSNHDPKLLQELEQDRAERLALRLTLKHLDAIMKDTRLPGEIADTYGVTAAMIIRMLHRGRQIKGQKETAERRRLEAAKARVKR